MQQAGWGSWNSKFFASLKRNSFLYLIIPLGVQLSIVNVTSQVRQSQESMLSDHDEEIAELSTSMHSGLTEGEGSDMQRRADDVRNAREVVERQRKRMAELVDAERQASQKVQDLEARLAELSSQHEARVVTLANAEQQALQRVEELEARLAEVVSEHATRVAELTSQSERALANANAISLQNTQHLEAQLEEVCLSRVTCLYAQLSFGLLGTRAWGPCENTCPTNTPACHILRIPFSRLTPSLRFHTSMCVPC